MEHTQVDLTHQGHNRTEPRPLAAVLLVDPVQLWKVKFEGGAQGCAVPEVGDLSGVKVEQHSEHCPSGDGIVCEVGIVFPLSVGVYLSGHAMQAPDIHLHVELHVDLEVLEAVSKNDPGILLLG